MNTNIQAEMDYYRNHDASKVKLIKRPMIEQMQQRMREAERKNQLAEQQFLDTLGNEVISWAVTHEKEAKSALEEAMSKSRSAIV